MQTSGPREYAQHKAIYGIAVDPYIPHQLTSYAEVLLFIIYYIIIEDHFRVILYIFGTLGLFNDLYLTSLSILCTIYPFLLLFVYLFVHLLILYIHLFKYVSIS